MAGSVGEDVEVWMSVGASVYLCAWVCTCERECACVSVARGAVTSTEQASDWAHARASSVAVDGKSWDMRGREGRRQF